MPLDTSLELPKVIELEPTLTCNLRCRMCHVSFMPDEPRPALSAELIDKLASLRGVYVILGSGFEPMMNRQFATIVRKLTSLDAKIELITNGTLLSDDNMSALLDADVNIFQFSFDGIRPDTYEHIRRNSKYSSTIDAICAVRQRFAGRSTLFSVNSTMMKRNMPEVDEIIDFWDRADFDRVLFLFMVVRQNEPELIRESLYPVRSKFYELLDRAAENLIVNRRKIIMGNPWFYKSSLKSRFPNNVRDGLVFSDNPATRVTPAPRQDFQLGAGPGMSFPCKSPWTFARIMANGDVQLCYQFTVGNLRDSAFEDIWFGDEANAVRARVAQEIKLCQSCDYYRFCLKSRDLDCDDPKSYFQGDLLRGLDTVDFEAGTMRVDDVRAPELIESIGAFNIVRFRGSYLGVPQNLGPLDLASVRYEDLPGLIVSSNLRETRRAIKASTGSG